MSINTISGDKNNNQASDWDSLAEQEFMTPQVEGLSKKINRKEVVDAYGDRMVYTDKDGQEVRFAFNPWTMMEQVERPEEMLAVAQSLQRMAERMAKDDENRDRLVRSDGKETGWKDAIKVDENSELGKFIGKVLKQQEAGMK